MSRLKTEIKGHPCEVSYSYTPGLPMRVTGSGYGDCDPPEPPEIEFTVWSAGGKRALWLESEMTEADYERVCLEIMKAEGDYCGPV